jgi:hypothetical protein
MPIQEGEANGKGLAQVAASTAPEMTIVNKTWRDFGNAANPFLVDKEDPPVP